MFGASAWRPPSHAAAAVVVAAAAVAAVVASTQSLHLQASFEGVEQ